MRYTPEELQAQALAEIAAARGEGPVVSFGSDGSPEIAAQQLRDLSLPTQYTPGHPPRLDGLGLRPLGRYDVPMQGRRVDISEVPKPPPEQAPYLGYNNDPPAPEQMPPTDTAPARRIVTDRMSYTSGYQPRSAQLPQVKAAPVDAGSRPRGPWGDSLVAGIGSLGAAIAAGGARRGSVGNNQAYVDLTNRMGRRGEQVMDAGEAARSQYEKRKAWLQQQAQMRAESLAASGYERERQVQLEGENARRFDLQNNPDSAWNKRKRDLAALAPKPITWEAKQAVELDNAKKLAEYKAGLDESKKAQGKGGGGPRQPRTDYRALLDKAWGGADKVPPQHVAALESALAQKNPDDAANRVIASAVPAATKANAPVDDTWFKENETAIMQINKLEPTADDLLSRLQALKAKGYKRLPGHEADAGTRLQRGVASGFGMSALAGFGKPEYGTAGLTNEEMSTMSGLKMYGLGNFVAGAGNAPNYETERKQAFEAALGNGDLDGAIQLLQKDKALMQERRLGILRSHGEALSEDMLNRLSAGDETAKARWRAQKAAQSANVGGPMSAERPAPQPAPSSPAASPVLVDENGAPMIPPGSVSKPVPGGTQQMRNPQTGEVRSVSMDKVQYYLQARWVYQ